MFSQINDFGTKVALFIITPATVYVKTIIPAEAGIQDWLEVLDQAQHDV